MFGMAAYNVSRRMKELGIRVALGARTKHVMSAAVGRPIALLVVGSLLGLLSGVLASRLLGNIVYQANPRDGHGRCGVNHGAAWHCGVCDSCAASACCRSIETAAGRVKQVSTLHASAHLTICRQLLVLFVAGELDSQIAQLSCIDFCW